MKGTVAATHRMMVKVLLYGYATGMFSSRGIARKLEEDVAFRVLGAGNFESHRTLYEFRRRHLEDFKDMLVEVAREIGLSSFRTLLVDRTKVRANASKRKATSYGFNLLFLFALFLFPKFEYQSERNLS